MNFAGATIYRNHQVAGKGLLAARFDNWFEALKPMGLKEFGRFIKEPRKEIDSRIWSYGFVLYKMNFAD